MTNRETGEFQARITDDGGIVRAKIPSPLVRQMGGRPGDYLVFSRDSAGTVSVRVSRARGGARAAKSAARKAVKKR